MAFTYKPLWKLLIDKDMTKKELMQKLEFQSLLSTRWDEAKSFPSISSTEFAIILIVQ